MDKQFTMSMFATKKHLREAKAKHYVDQNVWDGEDRSGAKGDRASFTPDELQELINEVLEYVD